MTKGKTSSTNAWKVKDVIAMTLLSVLLVAMQLVVNFVCMASDFASMVLSTGISMFLCAPVYVLMVARVNKRFVTLAYMSIVGLVYFAMGNWYLFPYFVAVGLACEAVLGKPGVRRDPKRVIGAWSLASLLSHGSNLLPIAVFWDVYYEFAMGSGMSQSYIDSYVRYYTDPGWLAFIVVFTVVMGFFGALVGTKLVNRHFRKAGVL